MEKDTSYSYNLHVRSLSMFGQTDDYKDAKPLASTDRTYQSLPNTIISAADIFSNPERPAEPWNGFDPSRYRDMFFYYKDGIAHLRGRVIDFTKDCGVNTIFWKTNSSFNYKL